MYRKYFYLELLFLEGITLTRWFGLSYTKLDNRRVAMASRHPALKSGLTVGLGDATHTRRGQINENHSLNTLQVVRTMCGPTTADSFSTWIRAD
jgi:hypothetical protein